MKKLADALLESIILHHQMIETMHKLRKLALIADFAGIELTSDTSGVTTQIVDLGMGHTTIYGRPWKHMEIAVRVKGEEVVRAKLTDAPLELWPEEMAKEFLKKEAREKKKGLSDGS